MRIVVLIIGIGCLIFMVAFFTDTWRFAKTIWLIAQVTPYEQTGQAGPDGQAAPRILVLGDSTGYGTGAGSGKQSIAGLLGADFSTYAITNNSTNGRTIGEALETIVSLPTTPTYDLILLQIGGNDILQKRPVSVVAQELSTLFVEANRRSAHVVMISSGNVGAAAAFVGTDKAVEYSRLSREFRTMFISVAATAGVTYVDLFQEPEVDVFALEPERLLAIDGLHPSAAGYAVWYSSLGPEVKKLLQ